MLQDVFNFASLQYKSALNTLKDEVKIGYRIAGDLEEDKNLSNATLDDYLLANNKVIDKEISSIETTLTQSREYAIYSCQKVLSSYQQMLSNTVLTDDKIYDIAKTISSHMFEVNSSSGIKTFTLSAVDFANEKFSNLQFTTNKIELTSLNDLSNINQTLIESIYIPDDIEKLPDGFLSNAINLKHIYFNCDSTKPKLKSIGKNAFYKAFKLVSLVFPANLSLIEDNAFHDCVNLQYVKFENPNTIYNPGLVFNLLNRKNCVFLPFFIDCQKNNKKLQLNAKKLFGTSGNKHSHDYQPAGNHVYAAACNKEGERVKSKESLQPTGSTPLAGPLGDWYQQLQEALWNFGISIIDLIKNGSSIGEVGEGIKAGIKLIIDLYQMYGIGTGDPTAIGGLILGSRLDNYNRFQIAAAAVDYSGYRAIHDIKHCVTPDDPSDPYGGCDKPYFCTYGGMKNFNGSVYGTAKIPDGTVTKLHTGNSVIDAALDGMATIGLEIGAESGQASSGGGGSAEELALSKARGEFESLRTQIMNSMTPCPI